MSDETTKSLMELVLEYGGIHSDPLFQEIVDAEFYDCADTDWPTPRSLK